MAPVTLKEGVVEKKGCSIPFFMWPERYLKVCEGKLLYYKLEQRKQALKIIPLKANVTRVEKLGARSFVVSFANSTKTLSFRTRGNESGKSAEEERDEWCKAIFKGCRVVTVKRYKTQSQQRQHTERASEPDDNSELLDLPLNVEQSLPSPILTPKPAQKEPVCSHRETQASPTEWAGSEWSHWRGEPSVGKRSFSMFCMSPTTKVVMTPSRYPMMITDSLRDSGRSLEQLLDLMNSEVESLGLYITTGMYHVDTIVTRMGNIVSALRQHLPNDRVPECDEAANTQQPAQEYLSQCSASSNPSLPSEGLVDGDSDACSHVSSEVGTEQMDEGKCSSPATLPTATQPSLDEAHDEDLSSAEQRPPDLAPSLDSVPTSHSQTSTQVANVLPPTSTTPEIHSEMPKSPIPGVSGVPGVSSPPPTPGVPGVPQPPPAATTVHTLEVFGTLHSTKLLSIIQNLQKMLLIDRVTPISDVAWSGLERMTEATLKMHTEQQAERVATSEIDHLLETFEAGATRKKREMEDKNAPKPAMVEVPGTPTSDRSTTSTSSGRATPTPAPPTVAPPLPPPLPSIGPQQKKSVAEIRSIFDKARVYKPNKRMKKLNWEKAPEYDARQPTTVWYKTTDINYPVRVSVSESHIESLFCLKMEGTDGRALKKSNTKTHLPDQKKALNINIVLDKMKKIDPKDPKHVRKVHMSTDEILSVVRDGNASLMTLNQATVFMEKAPSEEDRAFLEPFLDDPGARDKLGKVEQFLLGLLTIPAYSERLRVLRTKILFEEFKTDYQPIFILLHKAMKELRASKSLRDLFYVILIAGNFINGGTRLGSAYGFRISSLPRLSTTLANVKKVTLNVNFLHYLATVCEKDCGRLLNFHTELKHLDAASRVSVDVIQEELRGWHEEVNEIKEMMSSLDEGAEDFSLQLQEFVTSAEATLRALNGQLAAVRKAGKELAHYFCDNRDNFLEYAFVEIKHFSDEFSLTVKETMKEKPICLSPDPAPTKKVSKASAKGFPPRPATSAPSSAKTDKRSVYHKPSRATAAAATGEAGQAVSHVSALKKNPSVLSSKGHLRDSKRSPAGSATKHVDSHTQRVIVPPGKVPTVPQGKGRDLPPQKRTDLGPTHLYHHKPSTTGALPPSQSRRLSTREPCHPRISVVSRQTSRNEYKGHSPPLHHLKGDEEGARSVIPPQQSHRPTATVVLKQSYSTKWPMQTRKM